MFDKLPPSFIHEIEKTSRDEVVLRSNLQDLEDCSKWVQEYGEQTCTKWNSRSSKPCGKRFVCSKKFVCHHSTFMKVSADENKRGFSKNTACPAVVNIKVKLDTSKTRRTDHFIQKGLLAVITINDVHNHSLNTAEALKFLPASDCKEKFVDYFNDGMGIMEACKYHEGVLRLKEDVTEQDMANSRINPPYRAVQYWYDNWRQNLGRRTGQGLIEMSIEENFERTETQNSESTKEKRQQLLEEILNEISKKDKMYESSLSGLSKFLAHVKNCKSSGNWETFLHTAGKGSSKRLLVGCPTGAPPSKKRKHLLSTNISLNQPNAKCH